MYQIAVENDFLNLPDRFQDGYIELLKVAQEYGITVRCEQVGRSFVLTASEGLSNAGYFLKRFERAAALAEQAA